MRTIKNLFGSILIGIAVFLFWVMILPDYDERANLGFVLQSRTADFEAKTGLINKVLELDKEYQSKYAELKRLSLVVPSEKHLEEMITILEDIFSSTGVPLKDMALFAQDDQADSSYNTVNTEFNLKTTNDSVINFLISLEKNIRLTDVTEMTISADKDEDASVGSVVLNVTIKAKTYFLSKTFKAKSNIQRPTVSEE